MKASRRRRSSWVPAGSVKLLDFGVASLLDPAREEPGAALTAAGGGGKRREAAVAEGGGGADKSHIGEAGGVPSCDRHRWG
jgi:hypothetical protein